MPNQRHSHWYGNTQVPGSVRHLFSPYSPPIGWTIFLSPAPIGLLLQVALEHASVCLINATATVTEMLKSLVLSYLCFYPLPASYWLDIIYPDPIGQLL